MISKYNLMKGAVFALIVASGLLFFSYVSLPHSAKAQASFDPNNLINDPTFISVDAMSVGDIQNFLNAQGGFLKSYTENGRSAAQIIYDAAHGHGDASNSGDTPVNGILIDSSTGTVNPEVILTTLQKEQGLLNMPSQNTASLNAAMGYACPDSGGCNPSYAGFTKQVENGAWQLRYNYERAQGHGFSDYQVGQTMTFSDLNGTQTNTVTFANRATASLYRYTPHVYNGNYSFYTLYNIYFPSYHYSFVGENQYPPTLGPGDAYRFSVTIKNTGSATWQKGVVNLATDRSQDRIPEFTRECSDGGPSGWTSGNRITMQEDSVAPGQTATFAFCMRNDGVKVGTYAEYFRPVADGITWMEDDGIYWNVKAGSLADKYHYSFVNQNAYPTLAHGQSYQFSLTIKNTGTATWQKGMVNLATDRSQDNIPIFTREGNGPSGWIKNNRITMQEDSVAPGQTATFVFWMRNDSVPSGTYKVYFRPVADGITWMEDDGIYWTITIP